MAIYIKVINETDVTLAGQVADDRMLAEGFFSYEGEIPTESNPLYLKWDAATSTIVINEELKYDTEIAKVREQRTKLLAESEWITSKYADLNQPIPEVWAVYRQALRDITNDFDPNVEVVWPVKPTTN